MKIGRNAPCPCGSGKKYKHCCLIASAEAATSEGLLLWRRVRRALDDFPPRLLRFASEVYGDTALAEAWEKFHLWTDEDDELPELDPSSPMLPLFLSWFLHHWAPDIDTLVEDSSLQGRSPTETFLERRGRRLEPLLVRYLEGCLATPFSFHEILDVEPGRGFTARDVLTGEVRQVIEKSASERTERGDILFAQLVEVDGIVMVEAASPFLLPPSYKIEIMDLRRMVAEQTHLATPRERLLELDYEIRDLYLTLVDRFFQLPELRNTDGDPIELQRVVFDIESADAAFHALKHLCTTQSEDEMLASAERDANGKITRVEIDWTMPGNALHKHWTNTSLGRIEISGKQLIAEVNSSNRADTFRRIVEEALGEQARYRMTEIVNTQAGSDDDGHYAAEEELSPADLAESAEVKALIERQMTAHYEAWVDTELPALAGQTPRQAVADPEGREKVEALLCEFERSVRRMNLDLSLLQRTRQQLGLE